MSVKFKSKFSNFIINYFSQIVIATIVVIASLLFINRNAAAFSQNVITEFEESDSSFFQDISDEENSFLTDRDED